MEETKPKEWYNQYWFASATSLVGGMIVGAILIYLINLLV